MPIYEYHCTECGNEFEKLMRFSDPNINSPECPDCNSNRTKKRLSTVASFSAGRTSASNCSSPGPFR